MDSAAVLLACVIVVAVILIFEELDTLTPTRDPIEDIDYPRLGKQIAMGCGLTAAAWAVVRALVL